jgi:intracellular sulfur oxidation DsrE/DsrF family protein
MSREFISYFKWLYLLVLLGCLSLPVLADSHTNQIKVVYQMDDSSSARFALHIAKDQLQTNPNMKISLVAYGSGVDFLLKEGFDRSGEAYAADVEELAQMGVQFKVCLATLRFRDIPKEQVLNGVTFVPAGTYEVIRLQAEEGYVYLKP